jgi:hypothetical protein
VSFSPQPPLIGGWAFERDTSIQQATVSLVEILTFEINYDALLNRKRGHMME